MEDNLNGKQYQWKTTSMEDEINVRQPQWKITTLACLASQFYSELGPAQPQLVLYYILLDHILDYLVRLMFNSVINSILFYAIPTSQ